MLFAFCCKSKFKKGTMVLILDEFELPKTYYFANLNIAIRHLTRKGRPTNSRSEMYREHTYAEDF